MRLRIPPGRVRREFGVDEGAGCVFQGALVFGEGEVHAAYRMVGMRKLVSPAASPSGQRAVTVLIRVKKRTPSMPC